MGVAVRWAVVGVAMLCFTALPFVPDWRVDVQVVGLVMLSVGHLVWSLSSGRARFAAVLEWGAMMPLLWLCAVVVLLPRDSGLCVTKVSDWGQGHYGDLGGHLVHVRQTCWNEGAQAGRVHQVWLGLLLGPSVPFVG
ncbi:MAG: hypothetical protein KTR31_25635 [Myxococcales bacterium]|nr:hypothetical protein [Myxococcales bacterium]